MSATSVFVFVALVCVAVTRAAVFKEENPFAHALLQNQINDIFSAFSTHSLHNVSRVTRGLGKTSCCGEMPKISDDDKKLMKECKGDISSEDEGEHDKPKGKHFCGAACLFEKSNMMKDGSVDQDAFKKEILARYPDNMHPTVTSAIEKCVPKANSIAKDMGNVESEGQKCNPAPLITMACTYTTIQNTCPEDLKVKSDECDKRRAKCKEISKKFD